MLRFTTGDILAEDAEALVNTVNCVGVMGRGIALQFKKAFPENFRAYAKACQRGEVKLGAMFVFQTGTLTNPRTIINFPTKRHWRGNSRIEAIEAGLEDLVRVVRARGIRSMAVPPLGCGLGGLDWSIVRPRIEEALGSLNSLDVVVFEPQPAPDVQRTVRSPVVPKMTPGRAALVGLMDRYLDALLDPFVTLLEVHKLMYFLQVAGEPLRLRFTKGRYGPYAENLRHVGTSKNCRPPHRKACWPTRNPYTTDFLMMRRQSSGRLWPIFRDAHVLHQMEGHFISGFADGGDMPDKPLRLAPNAVKDAAAVLNDSEAHSTRRRFDRVAELVAGFESSFGLELLSTVHWVLEHEKPQSQDELVANVYGWNEHKTCFSPRQIALAVNVMVEKGWPPAATSRPLLPTN